MYVKPLLTNRLLLEQTRISTYDNNTRLPDAEAAYSEYYNFTPDGATTEGAQSVTASTSKRPTDNSIRTSWYCRSSPSRPSVTGTPCYAKSADPTRVAIPTTVTVPATSGLVQDHRASTTPCSRNRRHKA